ncbi:2-hydroxyhepta-2,4-diene-1,7-dioate isomerase [Sulfolobales archaeon HS-7]|nr:2-hydroxyhepta-2,4-diene-1,7-dioate isomerase [Sulfolobales archaeon HS-7]
MRIARIFTKEQETYVLVKGEKYEEISFSFSEGITTTGRIVNPIKFLPPVSPSKIYLPAVNFRSHSAETSVKTPKKPYFFTKFHNSLIGHEESIIIPRGVTTLDYEGELAVVIGRKCKYVSVDEAAQCIYGYTIANDISIREFQFDSVEGLGKDWVLGKGADSALPLGPVLVTKDEISFPLKIETRVNGEVRQSGTTEDMIFSFERMISDLTKVITLLPGDVITSGTPSGVGKFTGEKYLKDGDVVEVEISRIGTLRNTVKMDS